MSLQSPLHFITSRDRDVNTPTFVYVSMTREAWYKTLHRDRIVIPAKPVVSSALRRVYFLLTALIIQTTMASSFTPGDVRQVGSALGKFSFSLLQAVTKNLDANENTLISPFSVTAVLGMVYAGAKGQTAAQIKEAMHLSNFADEKIGAIIGSLVKSTKDNKDVTLASANQLYLAHIYPLAEAYEGAIKEHYGASPQNVDFGSDDTRAQINNWVEKFTQNKIKDILPPGSLNSLTMLVLVNAIYFKGNWLHKFDAALTKPQPFYLGSKDNAIDAHMMHIDGDFRTGDIESLDARAVELPYVGRKLSMFIVLPNQVDGLKALESQNLDKLLDEVDAHIANAKVHVAIPKFKLEAEVRMKDVLISLGMSHLFDRSAADLSGVSGKNDLYVSNVFHKSFIEVNEEGSEAAAATAGVMMMRCLMVPPPPPPPFIADHPFYYYIRDNVNNVVLFAGRMSKPHLG